MNRLFAMFRYSKKLRGLAIAFAIDLAAVLGLVVFDVVQLIEISSNSAKLSAMFIPFNVVLIVVCAINLIFIISFIIIKKYREKKDELKEN